MKLLYVADPMCSWCWGFSPVIAAVAERYADHAPVEVILGGLRAGNTAPMDATAKATIRQHWEHVHDASGQPFDCAFFDRQDFVYDTEPACRAVVVMRSLNSELALPYLARVHGAFYRENRDVTAMEPLAELAAEFGIEIDDFRNAFQDRETRSATEGDFLRSARMGVRAFPTLLGCDGDRLVVLTSGYQPLSDLVPSLDRWVDRHEN